MKKFAKILAPLAIAGMVAFTTACVREEEPPIVPLVYAGTLEAVPIGGLEVVYFDDDEYIYDFDFEFAPLEQSFMSASGKVVEIIQDGDMYFVLLECPETEDQIRFMVDQQSAVLLDGELAEGMSLVGYFDTSMPVPMIWPPQHRAVVLMEESPYNVLLARFYDNDGVLVSSDGIHSLNIVAETGIILEDGTPFEYELAGRKLLIEFYEEGTVITPARVTVLFETAVHPSHYLTDEELAGLDIAGGADMGISGGPALLSPEDLELFWSNMFDPETVQIIVLGEVIDAPTPFTCSTAGAVMLPVAAVAEALGYSVVGEGNEVIIAPGSIVAEGVNSYFRGRETPRELSSAPVMYNDVLFVPWEFFQEILSGAVMIEDGNVIVVAQE